MYICNINISLSISLSLSIYIYVHTHIEQNSGEHSAMRKRAPAILTRAYVDLI